MKRSKNIGIIVLLMILTLGVVFIPQLISGQREEHLLNTVVYRDYSAGQRPKLTSQQVAHLYHDRQIDVNYHSSQNSDSGNDAKKIRENVMYLTESLFSKVTDMSESVNVFIANGRLSCSRSSILILVDNQPTALNFVSCGVKGNDAVFEILYEEKTKTLISFLIDPLENTFHSNEEMDKYGANIELLISSYFEERLHLDRDEYYCSVEYEAVTAKGEIGLAANFAVRCGILRLNEKNMYE